MRHIVADADKAPSVRSTRLFTLPNARVMRQASIPLTRGTLNLYGDQSFMVYGQPARYLSATDSAGLTLHGLSGSIHLHFFAAQGAGL